MTPLLLRLSSCLTATLVLSAPVVDAAPQTRPNIVFILADDLGYMDIGANNPKTFYETPNIDALAAKGMRFKQGYAACPVCSPTRASILTGKSPQRVGITDFIGAGQPEKWNRPTKLLPAPYQEKLALSETTLAEAFILDGKACAPARERVERARTAVRASEARIAAAEEALRTATADGVAARVAEADGAPNAKRKAEEATRTAADPSGPCASAAR